MGQLIFWALILSVCIMPYILSSIKFGSEIAILCILYIILMSLSKACIFKKTGENPLKAFIPFYRNFTIRTIAMGKLFMPPIVVAFCILIDLMYFAFLSIFLIYIGFISQKFYIPDNGVRLFNCGMLFKFREKRRMF